MSAVDRVLAALDAGLQSSDERGYPDRPDNEALCARCLIEPHGDEGDLGPECRAYLLGDSDADPLRAGVRIGEVGWIRGYIATRYNDDARTYIEGLSYRHGRRVLFSRLDRDGQPVGAPQPLAGYAVHHSNGNPRNNDMSNLEIVPVAEVVDRAGHDAYLAEREQAFQRLAEGLSVPPELLEASRGVYDWAREEEARVAAERQNVRPETEEESCLREALGESWEAFSAVRQVQVLQRRIEASQQ